MKHSQLACISVATLAVVLLSACGGGGGGSAAPSSSGPAITFTPPTAEQSGLEAPTAIVKTEQHGALTDSQEVLLLSANIGGAAAARKLALLLPGLTSAAASPQACTDGGTVTFTSSAPGAMTYVLTDCVKGGYKFSGLATVSFVGAAGAATSFTVAHTDVQVEGPGGLNTTIDGQTTCLITGAAQAPLCVTKYAGYLWGRDFSYEGGIANGTYRCDCATTRNTTYDDFGAAAGLAHIVGTNGVASVVRTAPKTFIVVTTIGNFTYTSPENVFP